MRIAVTYDEGSVFQHFGHTEQFKVYETDNGKVLSSQVIPSNGAGHGALAQVLAQQHIDLLICGGIGGGAQAALAECGIQVCSGASGDADEAVAAYLRGELQDAGTNCHHHDGEHACSGHCGSSCGSGCGAQTRLQGKNVGKTCRVHYRGTLEDGTQFDSSYDRNEPLEFICGAGMMIAGFDAAVADMEVGQKLEVILPPEEAYGMPDPRAVFTVEISRLPGAEELEVGQQVYLSNAAGQPFPVTVTAKDGGTITFDANHELAGKTLRFAIEMVEVL